MATMQGGITLLQLEKKGRGTGLVSGLGTNSRLQGRSIDFAALSSNQSAHSARCQQVFICSHLVRVPNLYFGTLVLCIQYSWGTWLAATLFAASTGDHPVVWHSFTHAYENHPHHINTYLSNILDFFLQQELLLRHKYFFINWPAALNNTCPRWNADPSR